ncbi:MAG: alpha/beta hydrolase [Planctomycetota bacterium]
MPVRILRHQSRVLEGNPCGDPVERDVWLCLPPDYDRSDDRYAVLWCLAGFTGAPPMLVSGNRWAPGLADRLDRLVAAGCPPVIVAIPDCFTRWGGSQYVNSPALGRYEDYVCDELVPLVEGEVRASGRRGVLGKSSGGYGAVRLAMRRPGLFQACASHSGDMAFAYCYLPGFAKCAARIAKAGSLEKWVAEFEKVEKKPAADFDTINTLAMAAAYSPDPRSPFGFALPYETETGELLPEVWRRWREFDPIEMVRSEECAAALRGLRLLFLDCGSDDQFQIHLGLRAFVHRLTTLGIPHEAQEFPDDHTSVSYRYDVSIPKLARALATGSP